MELLEHISSFHKEIHDLHKENPDSTVGFQIEFLQFSMLKDDENKTPLILEEVCETIPDDTIKKDESEKSEKDICEMKYLLVPKKKKIKRSHEFSRKRSWVWKYFERLSNIIYRCNLCHAVLSIKGCNTNNMNRHVRTRHPGIYKAEVEVKDKEIVDPILIIHKEASMDINLNDSVESCKLKRSWIWSYFKRISDTLAQCNLCNRSICHGGNATGNMNRHLKIIHNKTRDIHNWVWKVFESIEEDYYTCKICQFKCIKFSDDVDKSIDCILHHLKIEHGVLSGDQIITGAEYEVENE